MIVRKNDNRVDELEAAMFDGYELIDFPLIHRFAENMYIREIFMPKGALLTSKIHKTQHPFTVAFGAAAVSIDGEEWEEFGAPYTGITQPGTRRILYILEDCSWITYHIIEGMKFEYNDLSYEEIQKIVDKIEDEILEPHINYITGTNINEDYKKILSNNKNIEL